ncbi:MAG TPA: preprotein translocase subunit SecE [Alphaproteobacteria bacterium]|nr:preprotein translocase subunit SecE [Alphaproteobacteria bacterium]
MGNHSSTPPQVPADYVAERVAGWHAFTRFTFIQCVAVAGLLVLMLVFLRIL